MKHSIYLAFERVEISKFSSYVARVEFFSFKIQKRRDPHINPNIPFYLSFGHSLYPFVGCLRVCCLKVMQAHPDLVRPPVLGEIDSRNRCGHWRRRRVVPCRRPIRVQKGIEPSRKTPTIYQFCQRTDSILTRD